MFYYKGRIYEAIESNDSAEIDDDYQSDSGNLDVDDFKITTKSVDPSIVVKKVNLKDKLFINIESFIELNLGKVPEISKIIEIQHKIYDHMKELAFEVSVQYNNLSNNNKDVENISSKGDSTFRRVDVLYRFISYYIIKYDKNITLWYSDILNKFLFNNDNGCKVIENAYATVNPDMFLQFIDEQHFSLFDETPSTFNSISQDFFRDGSFEAQEVGKSSGLFNSLDDIATLYKQGVVVKTKNQEKPIYVFIGNSPLAKEIVDLLQEMNGVINSIIKIESFKEYYINRFRRDVTELHLTHEVIDKQINDLKTGLANGSISKLSDFNNLIAKAKSNSLSSGQKEDLGKRVISMNQAYKLKLDHVKQGKIKKDENKINSQEVAPK